MRLSRTGTPAIDMHSVSNERTQARAEIQEHMRIFLLDPKNKIKRYDSCNNLIEEGQDGK